MTASLSLLVAASLASSPALPQRMVQELALAQVPSDTPYALNHSWPVDGAITLGAGLLWLGSEYVFKHSLAPTRCRLLCERTEDGVTTVNSWDLSARAARWAPEHLRTAALLSDAMVYLVLPATLGGLQYYNAASSNAPGGVWTDYLLILQTAALAQVVNQSVKFLVGRERPFANAQTLEERLADPDDDANLSFFSGHSTFAFALTVAAGTVSQLRGYKNAWMVWAFALPLAATVPYFRMAADKHYLSDVIVGSLVGAAFGVGIPLLHGRATDGAPATASQVSLGAMPGGISIAGRF